MTKKIIKDLHYCDIKDVKGGNCDIALEINGQDLIELPIEEGLAILRDNNFIKEDEIIIPAGLEVTDIIQHGGSIQYNFNNGFLKVDLAIDEEEEAEYFKSE